MYLKTNNYIFPCLEEKSEYNEDIRYLIGNPYHKPKPCILSNYDKEMKILIIDELTYYTTCSINRKMEKKDGTIEMIQGFLKAILRKYPELEQVELTDKSFYPIKDIGNIPLPEYMLLKDGMTWYQKYFNATPSSKTNVNKIIPYLILRERYIKDTELKNIYEFKDFMNKKVYEAIQEMSPEYFIERKMYELLRIVKISPISGKFTWIISKNSIKKYKINGKIINNNQLNSKKYPFEKCYEKMNISRWTFGY
jgi:hypothetical protein